MKAEMNDRQFFDRHLPPDGYFLVFYERIYPLDCFWAFGEGRDSLGLGFACLCSFCVMFVSKRLSV
jgi:hypothetical protein